MVTSTSSTGAPLARAITPWTTCGIRAPCGMSRGTDLDPFPDSNDAADPSDGASLRCLSVHVGVDPVESLRDGLLPVPEGLLACIRVHLGRPTLVLAPVVADVVLGCPVARRESGGVCRTECSRLGHLRPDHVD